MSVILFARSVFALAVPVESAAHIHSTQTVEQLQATIKVKQLYAHYLFLFIWVWLRRLASPTCIEKHSDDAEELLLPHLGARQDFESELCVLSQPNSR